MSSSENVPRFDETGGLVGAVYTPGQTAKAHMVAVMNPKLTTRCFFVTCSFCDYVRDTEPVGLTGNLLLVRILGHNGRGSNQNRYGTER